MRREDVTKFQMQRRAEELRVETTIEILFIIIYYSKSIPTPETSDLQLNISYCLLGINGS